MSDLKNQKNYIGCLIGGAVGDALGAPIEFMALGNIRSKYGVEGLTDLDIAYGLKGAITDDTQMTLFAADGILRGLVRRREKGIGGAELPILHRAYYRWYLTQMIDY